MNRGNTSYRGVFGLIARRPRLIIVGYFWNDLADDYSFPNLTVVDGYLGG